MKTALVTGSAKGLGRAIAVDLAKQGYIVCVNYRTSRKLAEETLKEVKKNSLQSIAIQGDMSISNDANAAIGKIVENFGAIDVLVNNAGDFIMKKLGDMSEAEFRAIIDSNLMSAFLCSTAAIPFMRKRKQGNIINIGASGCDNLLSKPLTTPYYIAKSGVLLLTRQFAEDEFKNGIRVNMISPGVMENSVAFPKNMVKGQITSFDDVNNAIRFLLSEKSKIISGANIHVTGGWQER